MTSNWLRLPYDRLQNLPPQNSPVKPAGHVQLNPSSCSKHEAPFKHGCWKHCLSSENNGRDYVLLAIIIYQSDLQIANKFCQQDVFGKGLQQTFQQAVATFVVI